MPKLFDCEVCPMKLKCTLTGEKDLKLKKWAGSPMLKFIWETLEKGYHIYDIGREVQFGICSTKRPDLTVDDYNKFMGDFMEYIKWFFMEKMRCEVNKHTQMNQKIEDSPQS